MYAWSRKESRMGGVVVGEARRDRGDPMERAAGVRQVQGPRARQG